MLATIHPALVMVAQAVRSDEIASPGIQSLITSLLSIRAANAGGGLAAPQIGISKRVFVAEYDVQTRKRYPFKKWLPRTIAINPEIELIGTDCEELWEGCLSQPGLRGPVRRHMQIILHACDENGQPYSRPFTGLAAGTIQHEYDHLNGRLFPDLVTDRKRMLTEADYQTSMHHDFAERAAAINARYGI